MITNALANQLIDIYTGRSATTISASKTMYLGLSTTTPTKAGANFTEPNGNGYARVMIGTYGQSATYLMSAASNSASTNTAQITFPKATGDWGTCTYAGLFESATGGTPVWYGALTSSIHPTADHVALILAGDLDMSVE